MRLFAGLAACLVLAACTPAAPDREDLPKIGARADWAQWPEGLEVGEVSAVDIDSHGHVFVLHRPGRDWAEPFPADPIAESVVAMFDPSGALLARWGEGETVMPHGLSIGASDTVWITDVQREQVLEFSHDGTLLRALGERGVSGRDAGHFGRPTDVAADDTRLLVADGYVNSRILSLAPAPARQWGESGEGEDGLAVPHSIGIHGEGSVVADRENRRIKQYGGSGDVERIIATPGYPYAAKALADGRIISLEGRDAQDREGAIVRLWSGSGEQIAALDIAPSGGTTRGHDLAIGTDGTLFVADVAGKRLLTLPLAKLTGQ